VSVGFRVLGEFEVTGGDGVVDIRRHQQCCVLAALLVDVNKVVLVDTLAGRVWGEDLPKRPREALYSYVSRLRTALRGLDGVVLSRRSGGYVVAADPETVDLHRFQRLLAAARAAQDEKRAAELLTQALANWTGDAFAGLNTPWIVSTRDMLASQRLTARLDLADIRLRGVDHTGLSAELTELAAAHPLDERLADSLMLALYRDGRQQDALRHYERVRRELADELGVDPGPRLRERYRQILAGETTSPKPGTSAPRQLPGAPRMFVGRAGELGQLSKALDEKVGVISAIGAGGVGKTWLALQWAHQNAGRFPDGQLFVNLHGFDPAGKPSSPQVAVRGFLESLGVDPATIPDDPDARTALYRSLVAGKRMLIVLDNAVGTAQVAPLLPGGDTCTVLVTSRDRLTGLITAHGARPLSLDVLPEPEARALLAARLGRERLAAEPGAVAELLARCAGLPLALSIVAGRAQTYPEFPLAALAVEFRDVTTRLGALDEQDSAASVRAVLSWSTTALSPEQLRVFGLLGLTTGPDISLAAVANLTGLATGQARLTLRALEQVSLLHQHTPDRYRMHDLVRLYAAEEANEQLSPSERDTALRGLAYYYVHTAHAGERLLYPNRSPSELGLPAPGPEPHDLPDESAAWAWFEAEHACLLAIGRLAAQRGWHSTVWQLAWALNTFLWRGGRISDGLTMWQAALAAAESLDDAAARAQAHRSLGLTYGRAVQNDKALEHLRQALSLAELAHNYVDQARIHAAIALALQWQKESRRALEHATIALRLAKALGKPVMKSQTLSLVGWLSAHVGEYAAARTSCEASLPLFRRHGDREGEAGVVDTLGFIAHETGRYAEALEHYRRAASLFHDLGSRYNQASTLERIGQSGLAMGDRELAIDAWRRALELYRSQHRAIDVERIRRRLAETMSDSFA